MTKIIVTQSAIGDTIASLQKSGEQRHEGIVLWLGQMGDDLAHVRHVYQPIHRAASDFFHIPREGMEHLMKFLDQEGVRVLAQVHSHPAEAFHSAADDNWALVRHLNALSLVLPYFAVSTTAQNFLAQVATFRLNEHNRWVEIPAVQLGLHLEIVP